MLPRLVERVDDDEVGPLFSEGGDKIEGGGGNNMPVFTPPRSITSTQKLEPRTQDTQGHERKA